MDNEYLIDPAISAAKFERELADYRQLEDTYIARGWFLVKAAFPKAFIVFGTPNLKPPAIAFGALLDFTNYDFWAPSVQLVDPFTKIPYKAKELLAPFLRIALSPSPDGSDSPAPPNPQPQRLVAYYDEDDIPFLCLPGTREYHRHPAHTGDSWLLHRAKGEGTLHFLIEQLYKYGAQYVKAYAVQSKVVGLAVQEIPM